MSYPGAIDCDVHPALANTDVLLPHLDEYWREMVLIAHRPDFDLASYPPSVPLAGRPDWRPPQGKPGSDLALLQRHALDAFGTRFAICNPLYGGPDLPNDDFAAALARAINDWIAKEWLDRDPRLRASIVIAPAKSRAGRGGNRPRARRDKRFVQVLVLAAGELPLGQAYLLADLPRRREARPADRHSRRQLYRVIRRPRSAGARTISRIMSRTRNRFEHQVAEPGRRRRVREISRASSGADRMRHHLAAGVPVALRQDLARRARRDPLGRPRRRREIVRDHVRLTLQPVDEPPRPSAVRATTRADRLGGHAAVLDRLSALAIRGRRRAARGLVRATSLRRS